MRSDKLPETREQGRQAGQLAPRDDPALAAGIEAAAEALKLVQQRPIEGHVKDNFVVGQQHAAGAQVTPKLR